MPVNIRLATRDDSDGILDIYTPIVLNTPISFEYDPPTGDEICARIDKTLVQYPWLVCEVDDRVAGYVYAGAIRQRIAYQWSTEVTAYVHEEYRGRRIGKTLYETLFKVLVLQGYYTAFAGITLPNPGSVALHESVGFTPLGIYRNIGYKFGAWHDVGWWERPLQATALNPENPRSIQEIALSDTIREVFAEGSALIRQG